MKKMLFLSAIFALALSARENPFTPQDIATPPAPEPIPPKIQIQKPVQVEKKVTIKEPQSKIVVKEKSISKPKVKTKIVKHHTKVKKVSKPKVIYNGSFAKIKRYKNTIQIFTKDTKLQHLKLTHPNRLAVDFERFDVVPAFAKKIKSRYVRGLKVGHHDYFYRITLNLAKNYRYKMIKKPYGYLIKLY